MPQMQRQLIRSERSGSGGFTLIELLVVIAIIGVLIGLLLPAITETNVAAKNVVEQASDPQLKSVGALSLGLANQFEAIYQEEKTLLQPVAEKRGELNLEGLRSQLNRLNNLQRRLDQQILPALDGIYASLSDSDKVLADNLRTQLSLISYSNRQLLHLMRSLLEPEEPVQEN